MALLAASMALLGAARDDQLAVAGLLERDGHLDRVATQLLVARAVGARARVARVAG